jgi:rhamnosyltransferase
VTDPLATVVVRTKDEGASIGRLIDLLARQTIAARLETVVVDSGSSDDTVSIARAAGVHVIEMPASEFTFGHSLNIGTAAASAPLAIALSAHAFPRDEGWAERMVATFDDPKVACACGAETGPAGEVLVGAFDQDLAAARSDPYVGYSNAAGGYRTELWRRRPFREDMPGTEDKEWAWHWLGEGWHVVLDPDLMVDHDHSHDPLPSVYERARREWVGYAMYLDLPPFPLRALAREWWTSLDGHRSHAHARLSPWRCARLAGKYAGLRR